jgi:quercetin dioxygenase-like cupin family protein
MKFGAVFGLVLVAAAAYAGEPALVTTQLGETSTTIMGQPIVVPPNPLVRTYTIVFAPGAKTGEHKHLYPHYALVEEGTLTLVNTQANKTFEIKAGTAFVEMLDTWHYGVNKGAVPVKLLIVDLIPSDLKANSIPKPSEK